MKDEPKNGGLSDEVVVRIAHDNVDSKVHWSLDAAEEIRKTNPVRFVMLWEKAEEFTAQCLKKGKKSCREQAQPELWFGDFEGPKGEMVPIFRTMNSNHPDMLSDWWFANRQGKQFDVRDISVKFDNMADHERNCLSVIRQAVQRGLVTNQKVPDGPV